MNGGSAIYRVTLSTFYERRYAFLMLQGLGLFNQVHFVLEDDEMLELHDFYGS